jgi:glutathione S-transferase
MNMNHSSNPKGEEPLVYGSPVSSFTRKVLLALEFKGIAHRSEMPDMELFARLNPLGKMPILATEGRTIIDSSVICDFLDRRYPDAPPLYPADAFLRARALWLEEYIDTALQASIYPLVNEVMFKPLRYGQPADPKVVEESKHLITDKLEYLESELTGETFVEGGTGIVEITLYAVLANSLRCGFLIDPARLPSLARLIGKLLGSDLVAGHVARYAGQIPKVPTVGETAA